MCVALWRAWLRCFRDQRHCLWFRPQGVNPVAVVSRLVLRCAAVVRVLGAVLRAVVALGTPARCGVCGSVRDSVAVVCVLRVLVLSRVQPSLCPLSSGLSLPVGPGCAGRLGAAVSVPLGRCVGVSVFFPLCAVHRVCRAGGVCVWCSPSASISGAVEVVGVAPRHVAVVLKRYGVLHPYPLHSLWRSSPGQIRNFPADATAS